MDMDCSGLTKHSIENDNNNNNIVIETGELIIKLGTDGKIILYWSSRSRPLECKIHGKDTRQVLVVAPPNFGFCKRGRKPWMTK